MGIRSTHGIFRKQLARISFFGHVLFFLLDFYFLLSVSFSLFISPHKSQFIVCGTAFCGNRLVFKSSIFGPVVDISMDVRAAIPESPEVNRLVTKRRCPFGESPQHCKIPATARRGWSLDNGQDQPLRDSAFELLMNSHKLNTMAQEQPLHSAVTGNCSCWVCQQPNDTLPCTFCEHGVCEMCVRQCDRCFGVFCSFCSTVNYDSREDRALCLTCHAEEFKRQKKQTLRAMQPTLWSEDTLQGSFPQATA